MSEGNRKFIKYMDFATFKEKIRDTKRNAKIGKKITVYTLKADSVTKRALTRRKAVVLAKYPRFAHVRLIGEGGHYGSEESFFWEDVAQWNHYLYRMYGEEAAK